jgi:N-methylhydantoinase B
MTKQSRMEANRTHDIIEVEVFRKALENLTNEMAITLKRASGSSIVVETHDFCTSIFDADGEQLAFSGWITMHAASSLFGVRETIKLYGDNPDLKPGDAIIVNDPYTSGALHQADVGIVTPLFTDDELIGWCFSNVHMLDIGGSAIGGLATTARDVWSEALRFPPTRIAHGGVLIPEWVRFISNSVRMPDAFVNDLRSMIAANNTAQRKVDELVARYGRCRYKQLSDASKDLSELALRERILKLADGDYEADEWVEYDGHGREEMLHIHCTLSVRGDKMRVALRGAPQIDAPVVGSAAGVIGSMISALLCMLTYDIPMNQGVWRHLEFDLGLQGTAVNPTPPAPVSIGHVGCGFRAGKMFNDVLSQACSLSDSPDMRARVAGLPSNAVAAAIFFGRNQLGEPTVSVLHSVAIGVGGGAQTVMDGLDCYGSQSMQGTRMPDVEVFEEEEPMLVLYRRLVPDSAGPGTFRGGLGMEEATILWSTDYMRGVCQSQVERFPPRGVSGGLPAGGGRVSVVRATNTRELLAAGHFPSFDSVEREQWPSFCTAEISRDDVVIMVGGGGGGLGDPLRRAPELVARDLLEERITAAVCETVYGVIVDAAGDPNVRATRNLRKRIRVQRLDAQGEVRTVDDSADPAVSVVSANGAWTCAACRHQLGPADLPWREHTKAIELPAAEAARARGQLLREAKSITLVERRHVCTGCGSLLGVDIARTDAKAPEDLFETTEAQSEIA